MILSRPVHLLFHTHGCRWVGSFLNLLLLLLVDVIVLLLLLLLPQ
jgi:hypothetical protein